MISIIVAFDQEYNIGKNNSIPWHFPEDLNNFKKLTTGNVCVMGRNTWESLPPKFRPLPNRSNIVVSNSYYKNPNKFVYTLEEPTENPFDAFTVPTLEDAFDAAIKIFPNKQIFVIGGASIYKECLLKNYIDNMIVTRINHKYEGDTKFPELNWAGWKSKNLFSNKDFDIIEYSK